MTETELARDHELVADAARSFLNSFVDNNYLNRQEESARGYDDIRWKHMCDLGWTSILPPEAAGGSGADIAAAAAIAREIGRAAYASPLLATLRATVVATELADPQRVDQLMARIVDGEAVTVVSPPDGTLCVYEDEGRYVVLGEPAIVEWFSASTAAIVLVPRRDKDAWLYAVLEQAHIPDERSAAVRSIDNERCTRLNVEGLRIEPAQVLGDDLTAAQAKTALAQSSLIRTAAMVGGAEAVLEFTADYARQRQQFGQPIGAFQAVRHHLARMVIAVDAARLSYEEALVCAIAGTQAERSASAAVASFVGGRSYVETVLTAAQIHGGIGTTTDHVLHHHFRRAKAMQLRSGKRDNRLRELTHLLVRNREESLW
jgi:alkylation response protein AidB-like acyl-CoA dehydrogenase